MPSILEVHNLAKSYGDFTAAMRKRLSPIPDGSLMACPETSFFL